jgi:phage baseplate assembly protein W
MAIKLSNLKNIARDFSEQNYLFKDLALDISQTEIREPGFEIAVPGSDIRASFDLAAIKNSLQNLFSTKPGERFLFPEYGLDLTEFLFTPITESNANILGEIIFNTINIWESRVSVENVQVTMDVDNNQYLINIIISVPILNLNTSIEALIDIKKQALIILPTSQIR